jgi:hypothetical protein
MHIMKYDGVPTDQTFESREKAIESVADVFGEISDFATLNLDYCRTVSARGNTAIDILEVKTK